MFVMSPDLLLVVLFTLLALWVAIGIFSSRLASESNCQECGEPVSYAMLKRGINDVALCGSCGATLGYISILAEQNDHDGPA